MFEISLALRAEFWTGGSSQTKWLNKAVVTDEMICVSLPNSVRTSLGDASSHTCLCCHILPTEHFVKWGLSLQCKLSVVDIPFSQQQNIFLTLKSKHKLKRLGSLLNISPNQQHISQQINPPQLVSLFGKIMQLQPFKAAVRLDFFFLISTDTTELVEMELLKQ